MIKPEDQALADALLRGGRLDRDQHSKILAELQARPEVRLKDLLGPDGKPLPPAPPPPAATLAPAGPAANVIPGAAAGPVVPPPPAPATHAEPAARAPVFTPPPPAKDTSVLGREKVLRRVGKYDLIEEIGRGGLGVVYRAHQNPSHRTVAVRIFTLGEAGGADGLDRFMRESRAAMAVSHPNVVQPLDLGEADDDRFVAMDYADGPSLEQVLRDAGTLPVRAALEITREIARGLEAAHRAGVVHRDVKPGNILLRRATPGEVGAIELEGRHAGHWTAVIGDFGLAREVTNAGGEKTLIGTVEYMSPEQAGGRLSRVGPAADVWSLGGVFYRMIAGRPPHAGGPDEVLRALQSEDPEPLSAARPELQPDIVTIASKSLARDPAARYASAAELADDIDRCLRGEAIRASPPGLVQRLRAAARRHTGAWTAAAIAVALLALAVAWVVLRDVEVTRDRNAEALRLVSEGRDFMDAGRYDEALRAFEDAQRLVPGLPDAGQGTDEARWRRFRDDIRLLLATGAHDAALARLNAETRWTEKPERIALARKARGTATLEILSDGPAEADLAVAEAAIAWDEETFPPLAAARESGLCAPRGGTPVRRFDVDPGEYAVIWSRGGQVERVLPLRIERGADAVAAYEVFRVEPGPGRVEEALARARPGAVIELAAGSWTAGWTLPGPGILLRGARGAILRPPEGSPAVNAGRHFAVALRDLEFEGGSEAAIVASGGRFSAARCTIRDFLRGGVQLGDDASDAVLRDLHLERTHDAALRAGGARSLVLMCRVEEAGRAGVVLEGPGAAAVRNSVIGSERIGIQGTRHRGIRILENQVAQCLGWGILVSAAEDARVHDNIVRDCATLRTIRGAAAIAAIGAPVDLRHNTVWGGGDGLLSEHNPSPFADNIAASCSGAGLVFQSRDCREFDYNLSFQCASYARFFESDHASLASLQAADAHLNLSQMRHGLEASPQFADPDGGDFSLRATSPARGAASDGGDVGARVDLIRRFGGDSAAWIRRANAEVWRERGRGALEKGLRETAAKWLRQALASWPEDEEAKELLRRTN
jgi:tetratricopeptide (TPR) repeat protein